MKDGTTFPPIRVWWDGSSYWLSDGFQRLAAAKQAGITEITCKIPEGSLTEAQWDSYCVIFLLIREPLDRLRIAML
jgi:hypothetical protein